MLEVLFQSLAGILHAPNGHYKPYRSMLMDYALRDSLGFGGFGKVYAAWRKSDRKQVAIKFIDKSKIPSSQWALDVKLGRLPIEIFVLKHVKHPNIVELFDYCEDKSQFIIVQELFGTNWANGKSKCLDLYEYKASHAINEQDAKRIFKQIIDVVTTLYLKYRIVHGDIKEENILVDSNLAIKLIDFGSAFIGVQPGKMLPRKIFHGTSEFASPEILKGLDFDPCANEVWSLGVFLYSLLHREMPFTLAEMKKHKFDISEFLDTRIQGDSAAANLQRSCLQTNPQDRIKLEDIIKHPWLN